MGLSALLTVVLASMAMMQIEYVRDVLVTVMCVSMETGADSVGVTICWIPSGEIVYCP